MGANWKRLGQAKRELALNNEKAVKALYLLRNSIQVGLLQPQAWAVLLCARLPATCDVHH